MTLRSLLLPAALLVALPAFAGPDADAGADCARSEEGRHGRPPGPPPQEVLLDHLDELGLADTTEAAVRAAVEAARPDFEALEPAAFEGDRAAHEALRARGRALMDEIRALLTDEEEALLREILPPPPGRGHGRGEG